MDHRRTFVASLAALLAAVLFSPAIAQVSPPNLPPPGGYQPIPNFTGPGAGLEFRTAINDRFSGNQLISPRFANLAFANLPAEQDGLLIYCTDCQRTIPCAGSGSGAWAFGQGGQWTCAAPGAIYSGQAAGGDLGGTLPNPQVNTVLGGKAPLYSAQTGAQINTLAGAKLDGSDAISSMSINGARNVLDFPNISNSQNHISVSTTAGSATVTGTNVDFKVGQSVMVPHAGAAAVATTPTLSVAPTCSAISNNPNVPAPTCSTSYTYAVQGVDAGGGISAASSYVTTTAGASTLSATNFNTLTISQDSAHNIAERIYKCSGASCTPTLYAVIPLMNTYGSSVTYRDVGHGAFAADEDLGPAIPASQPQNLLTTITAISGSNISLNTAPSVTGSFTMYHDDEPPVAAAVAALSTGNNGGGAIYFPAGVKLNFAQTLNLNNVYHLLIQGAARPGEYGAGPSEIDWIGPVGGTVVNMSQTAYDDEIDGISFQGGAANTPGIVFDINNAPNSGGTKNDKFVRDAIGRAGIGVRVGDTTSCENLEGMIFDSLNVGDQAGTNQGWHGYFIGCTNSYLQHIVHGYINQWDVGLYISNGGSVGMDELDWEANVEDIYSDNGLGSGQGYIHVKDSASESSQHFLVINESPGIFGGNVEIESTRLSTSGTTIGPDGEYIYTSSSPLTMIADNVCVGNSGAPYCRVYLGSPPGGCCGAFSASSIAYAVPQPVFLNNQFRDPVPISGGPYIELGDVDGAVANVLNSASGTNVNNVFSVSPSFSNGLQHASVTRLSDPSAPSVRCVTGCGSTSYTYYLACHDFNGGVSNVSSGTTITNGPATLSTSAYNQVYLASIPAGYQYCDVLRNGTTNSFVGYVNGGGWAPFHDYGGTPGTYTAPTRNTTGDLSVAGQLGNAACDGSGKLSGFNGAPQGLLNVAAFCASGSVTATTTNSSVSAGATTLPVNNGFTFANNQGLLIVGAGNASTLGATAYLSTPSAPAASVVSPASWAASTAYGVGVYIVPASANGYYYETLVPSQWSPGLSYPAGAWIWVNGYLYQNTGTMGTSGMTEPAFPTSGTVADGPNIVWTEEAQRGSWVSGTSGASAPTWPTGAGATVLDGSVVWQEQGAVPATETDTYQIVGIDGLGGYSTASSAVTVSSASTSKSSAYYTQLALPALGSGMVKYLIYRNGTWVATSRCSFSSFISQTYACNLNTTYNDKGDGAFPADGIYPTSAPASAGADWLVTSVSSGGGTNSLTIANPLITGVASGARVQHDDTAAITNAFGALTTGQQEIWFPDGTYNISSPITDDPTYTPHVASSIGSLTIQGQSWNTAISQFGNTDAFRFNQGGSGITIKDLQVKSGLGVVAAGASPLRIYSPRTAGAAFDWNIASPVGLFIKLNNLEALGFVDAISTPGYTAGVKISGVVAIENLRHGFALFTQNGTNTFASLDSDYADISGGYGYYLGDMRYGSTQSTGADYAGLSAYVCDGCVGFTFDSPGAENDYGNGIMFENSSSSFYTQSDTVIAGHVNGVPYRSDASGNAYYIFNQPPISGITFLNVNAAGFTGNGITVPNAAGIQNIVDIGDAFGVNLSGELAGAISDAGGKMMAIAPSLVGNLLTSPLSVSNVGALTATGLLKAGAGSFRSFWVGTTGSGTLSNGVNYFMINGQDGTSGAEGVEMTTVAQAATLKNLQCETVTSGGTPTGPGGSITLSWTVRKNSANSALTCSYASPSSTSCSDTTDSITVAAGDSLDMAFNASATPGTSLYGKCSVEVDL